MKKGEIKTGVVVALLVIVLMVVLGIMAVLAHGSEGASEGVVVDKAYHAITSPQPIYSPEKYMIEIITVRDGEDVKCWISCTEEEWNSYRIGDYFRR